MSSSYSIFKKSIVKILSNNAMESPQSAYFYDLDWSFLYFFCLSRIFDWINENKICFNETAKGKNNGIVILWSGLSIP